MTDAAEVEAWADETMVDHMDQYRIPGATVVVVANGSVVLAKGYGYADVEAQRAVDANETVFFIGSTGKLMTWTAVMQGVEDGRLDLDRDVNAYLTESNVAVAGTYPEPVTLEHLGTHSAGFEDSLAGMLADDPGDVRPLEELLVEHRPARVRPPGEFVAYSNYGTALAGHVVAEEYDTTFTGYVDERIFTPLGMDDTTYAQPLPPRLESRTAIGYESRDGAYRPQPAQVWTMAPQGGSLKSTGADMGRFMLTYLNEGAYGDGRILEAETVREMHQRHFTKAPEVPELNGMAYGFIEMDRNDERIVGHWGDTTHFKSVLALLPERDVGLFAVYNSPGGAPARFELLDSFVDRYYPTAERSVLDPPAGAAERAANLAGDYRSLTVAENSWQRILGVMTRTYTVRATDDGHLTTERLGAPTRTWVEYRPGVDRKVGGDATLVFLLEDGRGTHLFLGDAGSATYERVPWYESQTVLRGVVLGGVLGFASAIVLLPGGFAWRRLR
ncbi:serine hydrolase domain-containing protein, partial [Halobium palmae]